MVGKYQGGFALLEIMLIVLAMLILGSQAIPAAFKVYRQMVVEYEAEHILADIRKCQTVSRLTAESAWGYGAGNAKQKHARLDLAKNGNTINAGDNVVLESNLYLPGVHVWKIDEQKDVPISDNNVQISFMANGLPRLREGMMTLLIYYEGYPQEGRKIMISKGGRIRMERSRQ